jgi:hypothetical protein
MPDLVPTLDPRLPQALEVRGLNQPCRLSDASWWLIE